MPVWTIVLERRNGSQAETSWDYLPQVGTEWDSDDEGAAWLSCEVHTWFRRHRIASWLSRQLSQRRSLPPPGLHFRTNNEIVSANAMSWAKNLIFSSPERSLYCIQRSRCMKLRCCAYESVRNFVLGTFSSCLVRLVFVTRPNFTGSLLKATQKQQLTALTRTEGMRKVTLRPIQSAYESLKAVLRFFIAFEMVEEVMVALVPLHGIKLGAVFTTSFRQVRSIWNDLAQTPMRGSRPFLDLVLPVSVSHDPPFTNFLCNFWSIQQSYRESGKRLLHQKKISCKLPNCFFSSWNIFRMAPRQSYMCGLSVHVRIFYVGVRQCKCWVRCAYCRLSGTKAQVPPALRIFQNRLSNVSALLAVCFMLCFSWGHYSL